MADEYEDQRHRDRVVATLYRLDPDKLAAIRRAASGTTRCPECDTVNPADQRKCYRCGARLYYDLPDEETTEQQDGRESAEEQKTQSSRPKDDSKTPPYY